MSSKKKKHLQRDSNQQFSAVMAFTAYFILFIYLSSFARYWTMNK